MVGADRDPTPIGFFRLLCGVAAGTCSDLTPVPIHKQIGDASDSCGTHSTRRTDSIFHMKAVDLAGYPTPPICNFGRPSR
jgi:hypothetical protein